MALVVCPSCGKDISDKAKKCPHCGYEKEEEKKIIICDECGGNILEGEKYCPECGCPVSESIGEDIKPQKVEVTNLQVNKKSMKKVILMCIALLAIIGIVLGISKISKENAAVKAKEEYQSNLTMVTLSMLSGAADAEEAGNLIKKVWYNTIYEEYDTETDQYTRDRYGFNDDFNDSLQNLFSDASFQSKISNIESNRESVKSIMKTLQNPPEEYQDAYNTLKDYYDAYLELTEMAINPTGSLQTYSSSFSDADAELIKQYEAMQLYIE